MAEAPGGLSDAGGTNCESKPNGKKPRDKKRRYMAATECSNRVHTDDGPETTRTCVSQLSTSASSRAILACELRSVEACCGEYSVAAAHQ